jgi:hypothetical protein
MSDDNVVTPGQVHIRKPSLTGGGFGYADYCGELCRNLYDEKSHLRKTEMAFDLIQTQLLNNEFVYVSCETIVDYNIVHTGGVIHCVEVNVVVCYLLHVLSSNNTS